MGFFTPDYQDFDNEKNTDEILKYINHSNTGMRLKAFNWLLKKLERDDVIKYLQHFVDDPDRKLSAHATIKLLDIGCDNALERARDILSNGRWEDKIKILYTLTAYTGENINGALNLVLLALKDKKIIITIEAIKALGSFHLDMIIYRLDNYLHDKNFQVRKEAVLSLARSGGEKSIDLIVGGLIDGHPEVRVAAKQALEAIGTEKALEVLKNEPFMHVVKCMNQSASVRENTAREIGENQLIEGIPLLIKACNDEYKNVRIESVRSLGSFHDPEYIEVLEKMLEDKYHDVRVETVYSLEKIRSPRALQAIEKAMKDKNINVRNAARESYYNLSARLEKSKNRE